MKVKPKLPARLRALLHGERLLNRDPDQVQSRMLAAVELGILPLVFFYGINNFFYREYLYAFQNLAVAGLTLASLMLLSRGRYRAAAGVLFCGLMPLVQLVFILAEYWASSAGSVEPYDLAALHCAIGIILAGSFSRETRQFAGSVIALITIFLIHTLLLSEVLFFRDFSHLGIIIYQFVAILFGAFIFLSQRQLASILEERRLLSLRLVESAAENERLIANISQEIRSPLSELISGVARLRHTDLDEEQAELLSEMDRGGSDLNTLLSNLLVKSRHARSDRTPVRMACDLGQLLRMIIARFERLTPGQSSIRVSTEALEYARISTDPAALDQILTNLIDNALKASSPPEEVEILARSQRQGSGEAVIEVIVSDRGAGIPNEAHQSIFEPYYRLNEGGAGLGLSAARELAPLVSGEVDLIESGPKGSSFLLIFTAEPVRIEASEIREGAGESRRICIAEDNGINLLNLKSVLGSAGFEVYGAVNGYEAMACVEEYNPEVLVLDMQMPGMDGFECARRLREHPLEALRRLPIIAITGYSFAAERRRILACGVNEILLKPFDERELLAKIEELRKHHQGAHSLDSPS